MRLEFGYSRMTLLRAVVSICSLQAAVTYLRMSDTKKKKALFLRRHNTCIFLRNAMSSNPVYAIRCPQPPDGNLYKIPCTLSPIHNPLYAVPLTQWYRQETIARRQSVQCCLYVTLSFARKKLCKDVPFIQILTDTQLPGRS
jgi:hypothetical protein